MGNETAAAFDQAVRELRCLFVAQRRQLDRLPGAGASTHPGAPRGVHRVAIEARSQQHDQRAVGRGRGHRRTEPKHVGRGPVHVFQAQQQRAGARRALQHGRQRLAAAARAAGVVHRLEDPLQLGRLAHVEQVVDEDFLIGSNGSALQRAAHRRVPRRIIADRVGGRVEGRHAEH